MIILYIIMLGSRQDEIDTTDGIVIKIMIHGRFPANNIKARVSEGNSRDFVRVEYSIQTSTPRCTPKEDKF